MSVQQYVLEKDGERPCLKSNTKSYFVKIAGQTTGAKYKYFLHGLLLSFYRSLWVTLHITLWVTHMTVTYVLNMPQTCPPHILRYL